VVQAQDISVFKSKTFLFQHDTLWWFFENNNWSCPDTIHYHRSTNTYLCCLNYTQGIVVVQTQDTVVVLSKNKTLPLLPNKTCHCSRTIFVVVIVIVVQEHKTWQPLFKTNTLFLFTSKSRHSCSSMKGSVVVVQ